MVMNAQRGSVIIFILIGIVLFAALSYTIMQSFQVGTGPTDRASEDTSRLNAGNILDFARAVQLNVTDMKLNGIPPSAVNFIRPTDAGFDTPPHAAKIFHPEGGGAKFVPVWIDIDDIEQATATDWAFPMNTIPDVGSGSVRLLTLVRVPIGVCRQINQMLVGSTNIPTFTGSVDNLFVTGATQITALNCAGCSRVPAQCVENAGVRVFYFVLDRG